MLVDFGNLNTSKVTDMGSMFYGCKNLQTLYLSKFDTSMVKNMGYMFYGCSNLQTLDLSKFDTSSLMYEFDDGSKREPMSKMFKGCYSLKAVKLPKDAQSRQKLIDQLKKDYVQCTVI